MASALGKRKRRDRIIDAEVPHQSTADENSADLQALFRQHFESKFEPLPSSVARSYLVDKINTEPPDKELESDWDGFSEDGEEPAETVHCAISAPFKADVSKAESKTFMVRGQVFIVHQ